jgi:hypothetical protein
MPINSPPWKQNYHEFTYLFHGCLREQAVQILKDGLEPHKGRVDADFGQGFYTTSSRSQAEHWGYLKNKRIPFMDRTNIDKQAVVLWCRVDRSELAKLHTLVFLRGDAQAEEFWSFVLHCRSSPTHPAPIAHHHERVPAGNDWYDMVCGPLTAFFDQPGIVQNADQFSFHTQKAFDILNQLYLHGVMGTQFGVETVV